MEQFDVEKAKAGTPVVTRSGKSVKILCYDRLDNKFHGNIVALVSNSKDWERVISYDSSGHVIVTYEPDLDLFLNDGK